MVTRHVTRYGQEAWPEELAALTKQLQYYNERLLDFTQAQIDLFSYEGLIHYLRTS